MGSNATSNEPSSGVLEERRSSPGLLLALLGQEAMRRLREAHTANNLKPRQFQLLGLLHYDSATRAPREAEDALFAGLDDNRRQELGAVLLALRDSLSSGVEDAW